MKNKLLIATMFLFLLVWITVGFIVALLNHLLPSKTPLKSPAKFQIEVVDLPDWSEVLKSSTVCLVEVLLVSQNKD